mmetsp:Transcript_9795/g.23815  ORF Transcript_9795/g.23815 Transcript_9795/m.23815 type:complete len:266 (+) Transcript_9795:463-1260(+)
MRQPTTARAGPRRPELGARGGCRSKCFGTCKYRHSCHSRHGPVPPPPSHTAEFSLSHTLHPAPHPTASPALTCHRLRSARIGSPPASDAYTLPSCTKRNRLERIHVASTLPHDIHPCDPSSHPQARTHTPHAQRGVVAPCAHLSSDLTTWSTLRLRMSAYVCPTPQKTIGLPVVYTSERAAPTLSEMVSNLVSMMPSMSRGSRPAANSDSERLKPRTWSTASLPASASPTKRTRSGWLRLTSLERARMRGSLSCMRPAVSTMTTS